MDKKEGMIPVPRTRWNPDGFHDPTGKPGTIKAKEGNFLDIDLGAFDAGFFSMTAAQIEQADPQQRILLETVYESVMNAGEKNIKGRNIGVYVGLFAEVGVYKTVRANALTDGLQDWIEMHSKDSEPQTFFGYTGHFDLMDSKYKSYVYL